jgi:hypothetical protein
LVAKITALDQGYTGWSADEVRVAAGAAGHRGL